MKKNKTAGRTSRSELDGLRDEIYDLLAQCLQLQIFSLFSLNKKKKLSTQVQKLFVST